MTPPFKSGGWSAQIVAVLLASAFVLAACSSSQDPRSAVDEADALVTTGTEVTTTEVATTAPSPTTTTSVPAPPATDAVVPTSLIEVEADDDLVRRPEENSGTDDGSHWIGRNLMTDSSIEVVWSDVEGNDVTYRVYRTEITADLDREGIELTDDLLVYEGPAGTTSFTDSSVETGTFYSYLLAVEVDDNTLTRRWANALAVTDTDPPTPISGLTAEIIEGEVVLRWNPSNDDVEFASYSVSLVVDGELRYLGGGGDPSQSSFVDTRPAAGTNTYSVQAVDFHNNRTEEVRIDVVVS